MLRTRVIPTLLLRDERLVKTVNFRKFTYVGDPCNTVRIFNELEVDELLFLDISATREKKEPNYNLLMDIATECFMPLSYGGGVRTVEHARKIINTGFEKVCVNTVAIDDLNVVRDISEEFGAQAVIGSIDYKNRFLGEAEVVKGCNQKFISKDVIEWAKALEQGGVGEILLTSVEREGSWKGYDIEMLEKVSSAVNVPVIAHGGCGSVSDIVAAVKQGGASAVALGSMVVFQKKGMGVLVNFPCTKELEGI